MNLRRPAAGRDWAAAPLTADQLGELLFRAARIRWTKARVVSDDYGIGVVRPYRG